MRNIVWGGVLVLGVAIALGATDVPPGARRDIKAANDAWIPALQRQDAAALAEPYADDSVFVTATGASASGRDGIERLMRDRFAAGRVVDGTLTQDGVRMEGALVYEWGHARLTVAGANGATSTSRGRYVTVWKRGADGRWRIWRNLSLPD